MIRGKYGGGYMVSRTKPELDSKQIQSMFDNACLGKVTSFNKLGDGEYNAVYDVITDMGNYVLKVSPLDKTGILTYEQDMMRGEVFWYAQIRTHTNVKVPYVYFKDFSHTVFPSDYFIMERMEGEQLNNSKLSDDEKIWCKEEIARIIAQFHKVKNDKFGYLQNKLYDNWYLALRNMTLNLINDTKRAKHKTKRGEKLLKFIDEYKALLESVPCSMVNLDMWYGNILSVRKNNKIELIVIDPERTIWGDAIFDFVNLEFENMLDKKTTSLKAYNSVSKAKINCTKEEMIRFAFGIGYLALIQEAEKYYRYTPHHYGWWRNVSSCKSLYSNAFRILKQGLK